MEETEEGRALAAAARDAIKAKKRPWEEARIILELCFLVSQNSNK